jgi:hypothetical protein
LPSARNQLTKSSSCLRIVLATFFIGSNFDLMVRVHHSLRKRRAQPGDEYSQNR